VKSESLAGSGFPDGHRQISLEKYDNFLMRTPPPGSMAAIWAYLQITLEGCDVNLQTWQVLDYLRECRPH